MNTSGLCVFLDVEIDSLVARLLSAKTERPLIKGKTSAELHSFIERMMVKRRPFYEKASCVLKGKDILPEQIIEVITSLG